MKVTIALAKQQFKLLNKHVFFNTLEEPEEWFLNDAANWDGKIVFPALHQNQKTLGFCYVSDNGYSCIGLRKQYPHFKAFLETLCHEMAHLAQRTVLEIDADHGPTFQGMAKIAKRVAKLNIN